MSQSLCYLLGLYGIGSMAVVGTGESEAHQWAIVQMNDGKWYDTDVTWDNDYGGKASYNYFLVGSEKFDVNHRLERYTDEEYVPSYSAGRLPEISASAYPIRPGEVNYAEVPCTVTEDGENAVAAVTLENLDYVYDLAQGVGYCVVVIGDHGKIALKTSDVPALMQYMQDNALTEISFVKNTVAKQITVGPITAENDVHTFAVVAGSERISLSDISEGLSAQIFIPYTPMAADVLDFLICAWYADHPIDPVDGSNYSGGYVCLTTTDLEQSYIVGSTPLKDLPASVIVIGGLLLILIIIGLIKHRRTKRNLRYLMDD